MISELHMENIVSVPKGMPLGDLTTRLIQSEQEYVDLVLKPMVDFVKTAKKSSKKKVFENIEDIYQLHQHLVSKMLATKCFVQEIGAIFEKMSPFFKIYVNYLIGYEDYEKTSKCQVEVLIDVPLKRLNIYQRYLEILSKKLPKLENIQLAVGVWKETLEAIQAQVKEKRSRDLVVKIQVEVFKNQLELVDSARCFIDQVDMLMLDHRSGSLFSHNRLRKLKVHVILFNDLMLISDRDHVSKLKRIVRLNSVSIQEDLERKRTLVITVASSEDEKIELESYTDVLFELWKDILNKAVSTERELLTGAHISDEDFEAMIMKKIPQIPLVHPEHVVQFTEATNRLSQFRRSLTLDSEIEDKQMDSSSTSEVFRTSTDSTNSIASTGSTRRIREVLDTTMSPKNSGIQFLPPITVKENNGKF
jgi:hypothetical protein